MTNLNTFRFDDHKGIVITPKNSRDCKTADNVTAGDIVKIKNVAGPITVVEKITADTDVPFGVVAYDSAKKVDYTAGEIVNIAYDYSIVKMEASAAINAGAKVMPVVSGMKVATASAGKTAIGQACIPAAAAGELIPVMLFKPETIPSA